MAHVLSETPAGFRGSRSRSTGMVWEVHLWNPFWWGRTFSRTACRRCALVWLVG